MGFGVPLSGIPSPDEAMLIGVLSRGRTFEFFLRRLGDAGAEAMGKCIAVLDWYIGSPDIRQDDSLAMFDVDLFSKKAIL